MRDKQLRELRDLDGQENQVPQLLEVLRWPSADDRYEVRQRIRDTVYNQYELSEAGAGMVPELVALASDPSAPDRLNALLLAVNILTLGHERRLRRGLDLRDPELAREYADDPRRAAYEALLAREQEIVTLLSDEDSGLRGVAALALGFLFEAAPSTLERIAQVARTDNVFGVRASALIALGMLTRYSQSEHGRSTLARVLREGETELDRGAALVAAMYTPDVPSPLPAAPLRQILENAYIEEGFYYDDSSVAELAGYVGQELPSAERLQIARELASLLVEHNGKDPVGWMDALLRLAFDERKQPLGLSELTREQHALLEQISALDLDGARFVRFGLPARAQERREWLDGESSSVMTRVVPIAYPGVRPDYTVGQTVQVLIETGLETEAIVGLLEQYLSKAEVAEVLIVLYQRNAAIALPTSRIANAVLAANSLEFAERLITRSLALVHRDSEGRPLQSTSLASIPNAALAIWLRHRPANQRQLPPEYWPLVSPAAPTQLAREVMAAMPVEAQEEVVLSLFRKGMLLSSIEVAARYWDLAMTERVLDALVAAVDSFFENTERERARELGHRLLSTHAGQSAIVDATLAKLSQPSGETPAT